MSPLNQNVIEKLIFHRNAILNHLESINSILQQTTGCGEEYYLALSHYIPQIITALQSEDKWLPRGEYNLQKTIDNLKDQLESSEKHQKGVKKYIF
jgi:hypothetical protein